MTVLPAVLTHFPGGNSTVVTKPVQSPTKFNTAVYGAMYAALAENISEYVTRSLGFLVAHALQSYVP